MKKKLTIYGVNSRIEFLTKFRDYVVNYFNGIQHDRYSLSDDPQENEESRNSRVEINLSMKKARRYVGESDVGCIFRWTPPPAVGGYVQKVDLVTNIFNIHRFQISPQYVIDVIEQAIGVFEDERKAALIRTFNPFFWLSQGLSNLSSVPFSLLEHAGLYGKKVEDSITGRVLKLLTEAIIVLVALYNALALVGREDLLTQFLPEKSEPEATINADEPHE